ncbi:hypothetical protein X747_24765 [Mesorhizobium sp. LNJC384A00]|nr:hypothetical protein X747_24765 [Mesorhizobium sp. LNJC384A00]
MRTTHSPKDLSICTDGEEEDDGLMLSAMDCGTLAEVFAPLPLQLQCQL